MTLQNHKQIMQTDKSKTPRTDDQIGYKGATMSYVSIDFARTLERELTAKDAELAELRGMYGGMKDCQKNANEAAREFADAATRAEAERDELRAALASEKDDKDTAIEMLNRRGEMLAAERAHADRLAAVISEMLDCGLEGPRKQDIETAIEALTAHEARRTPNAAS